MLGSLAQPFLPLCSNRWKDRGVIVLARQLLQNGEHDFRRVCSFWLRGLSRAVKVRQWGWTCLTPQFFRYPINYQGSGMASMMSVRVRGYKWTGNNQGLIFWRWR